LYFKLNPNPYSNPNPNLNPNPFPNPNPNPNPKSLKIVTPLKLLFSMVLISEHKKCPSPGLQLNYRELIVAH
jgi:hypothetical protein